RSDLGLLRVGMDQVMNRPFSISEWTSVVPNEWVAEGPPVIAFYGLGLQGWDASFHFASNHSALRTTLSHPTSITQTARRRPGFYRYWRGLITVGMYAKVRRSCHDGN